MVWSRVDKECWIYREKNAEDGTAREEEKRKAKEEVYRCGEGGPQDQKTGIYAGG